MKRFLLLFLATVVTAWSASAQLSVSQLRTEHLTDPVGIGERRPLLSWEVSDASRRGVTQSAYEIRVKSGGRTVWRTGKVAGTLDRAGRERRPRCDVPPHVPCDETRGRGDRLCDRPRHLRGERQRAPCERRPSDAGLDGLQEAAAISGLRHHAAGGQGRQCHRRYRGQGVVVVETAVEPRVQLRRQVRPAGADRSPLQGRYEGGDRYRRHVARLDGRSELRQPLRRRDDRSEPSPEGVEHPVVRRCVVGFGAGGRHLAR